MSAVRCSLGALNGSRSLWPCIVGRPDTTRRLLVTTFVRHGNIDAAKDVIENAGGTACQGRFAGPVDGVSACG